MSTGSVSQVASTRNQGTMTNYRRFVIVAGPYQLFESGRWTVDLKIRRNGRGQAFSLAEQYPTAQEAEARCLVVGRRIIDGGVPGWSVEHLRTAPRGGGLPRRLFRAGVVIATVVVALWAFAAVALSASGVTSR